MPIVVTKDLRPVLGQVRDQNLRATCLAFAASAAHGACFSAYKDLSVEYLFACAGAREAGFRPELGLLFSSIHLALSLDGQPDEDQYPYNPTYPEAATLPPIPKVAGPLYKKLCPPALGTTADIIRLLETGPVILGLEINTAFYSVNGQPDVLVDPDPSKYVEVGGHAVVAVGHGHDDKDVTSTRVLVRNSWGDAWGASGHAWITNEYLDARLQCFGYMQ